MDYKQGCVMSMREATFILPLPPSSNMAYPHVIRHSSRGIYAQRVSSAELVDFKKQAVYIMREYGVPSCEWKSARSIGYEADIYVPTRASDLGNRAKALEDSMQFLGFNDNRIDDLHLRRHIDKEQPRVEVRLFVIE